LMANLNTATDIDLVSNPFDMALGENINSYNMAHEDNTTKNDAEETSATTPMAAPRITRTLQNTTRRMSLDRITRTVLGTIRVT
jgi:hypothetical protein